MDIPGETPGVPYEGGTVGGRETVGDGQGGWGRDYFDDAPAERTRHKVTRRELDELCFFVGLLVSSGRWPPPRREADDDAGPFGITTIAAAAGEVYAHHLRTRPAGTRDIVIFFAALPEQRRVRIVNVIASRRLRSARERSVITDAAALRALLAAAAP